MDSHTRSNLSTPSTSPGVFSPTFYPRHPPVSAMDGSPLSSPFLHPLKMNKVKETHKGFKDQDMDGRKRINQYTLLNLLGQGEAGKVKEARNEDTGAHVAIKIVPRYSKRRRLGKVTVSPEAKTKREIAILKKVRHPNIVGLLEVIDDPEWKKIYMVLEYVKHGEFPWRVPGDPLVCHVERRRYESLLRGDDPPFDAHAFFEDWRRHHHAASERSDSAYRSSDHLATLTPGQTVQFEGEDAQSFHLFNLQQHGSSISGSHRDRAMSSNPASQSSSRAPSRGPSRAPTPFAGEFDFPPPTHLGAEHGRAPLRSVSEARLSSAFYAYGEMAFRGRSPSVAGSHASFRTEMDELIIHDAFEEDFAGLPCVTFETARTAFREMVLGLEYLHYEGIVHRDIKPSNILYTADHRVKISDFGVSYFGKPDRDPDPEEISEADATDFDDDLELAKTVGTPAFFPPELCTTDLERPRPKVTEQIDIWSLGVTLYCMIYSRVPFLADNQFALFHAICHEAPLIPRQRLRPVRSPTISNPLDDPSYRQPSELAYEEVDDELHDLLRRMLIKNPAERIKLREIKRHPWVVRGIDNVIGWLDDTDPSRKSAVSKAQPNPTELEHAVVPITFLERMKSFSRSVKGKVESVIGSTKSDRSERGGRSRAASSVTSSENESAHSLPPHDQVANALMRRASQRNREEAERAAVMRSISEQRLHRDGIEHPLSQSLTTSPEPPAMTGDYHQAFPPYHGAPRRLGSYTGFDYAARPSPSRAASNATSLNTVVPRGHSHSRSLVDSPLRSTDAFPPILPEFPVAQPAAPPPTSTTWARNRDFLGNGMNATTRTRSISLGGARGGSRSRSVSVGQRGVMMNSEVHAGASLAMSPTVAGGQFEHLRPLPSPSSSYTAFHDGKPLPDPLQYQSDLRQLNHRRPELRDLGPSLSSPYIVDRAINTVEAVPRPPRATSANRGRGRGASTTSLNRPSYSMSTQDTIRPDHAADEAQHGSRSTGVNRQTAISTDSNQPTEACAKSNVLSPVLAQSEGTSPVSSVAGEGHVSVPSLPALVSSRSSMSADTEGDFLQQPGVVQVAPLLRSGQHGTPNSITPQSLSKQTSIGSAPPSPVAAPVAHKRVRQEDPDEGYQGDGDVAASPSPASASDDDSDSDRGIIMMKPRRRLSKAHPETPISPVLFHGRGRNASIGSVETAKKIPFDPPA